MNAELPGERWTLGVTVTRRWWCKWKTI